MAILPLRCVLFDLDGTLVDTSGDLIAALNVALAQHQFSPAEPAEIKPYISYGAAAMIKQSVTPDVSSDQQAELLDSFLTYYQHNLAQFSHLFAGMTETLAMIETNGLKWGIITNKRKRFTTGLMQALALEHRAACIVSGDTTPYSKPHPAPMITACRRAHVTPNQCVFIGDARHDIAAGRSVNMRTLAATYGFLKPTDQPECWRADQLVASPQQITAWIQSQLCH